ncbi:MAG TPA: hypothetical protein VGJ60_28235 [Chloroflexota bacterium]|jgi:hypothetical protein
MSNESRAVYAVPTHLREREPFAFGRTVGEVAKLVAIGFVAIQIVTSPEPPTMVRLPLAGVVLVFGAAWTLVRIQKRPLDQWLGLAYRYGATPRRRVWRSGDGASEDVEPDQARRGWFELERIRVRWPSGQGGSSASGAASTSTRPNGVSA